MGSSPGGRSICIHSRPGTGRGRFPGRHTGCSTSSVSPRARQRVVGPVLIHTDAAPLVVGGGAPYVATRPVRPAVRGQLRGAVAPDVAVRARAPAAGVVAHHRPTRLSIAAHACRGTDTPGPGSEGISGQPRDVQGVPGGQVIARGLLGQPE